MCPCGIGQRVHMRVYMCEYVPLPACYQRLISSLFLDCPIALLLFFETVSCWPGAHILPRLADQEAPGTLLPPFPQLWDYRQVPSFYLGAGDQSSGSPAWTTGPLPAEPSPQFLPLSFFSPLGCDTQGAEAGREHLELGEQTEARSHGGLSCGFTGPGREGDTVWHPWDSSISAHAP